MDFEEISSTVARLADDAVKGCGLSHDLYVKRFSLAIDREFRDAAADVVAIAYDLAAEYDYASPNMR
jgi:hypothetical protein